MRELYIEGVAVHGGPESCVVVCEDCGEALTGVRAGWAIEPRNHLIWGADVVSRRGRPHRQQRYRELLGAPRGLRTWACTESPCARTGRSHSRPSG
jgi:hypothetical protein